MRSGGGRYKNSIRTGTTPACDAREGRRSVELVEAIYRAAQEDRSVTIE